MNQEYLNKITNADCCLHLPLLENDSIDLFLSDIPYGIGLDDWDVLHNNTNSGLFGSVARASWKIRFQATRETDKRLEFGG
jgi:site-specific DNA-methyltransferase (adenine-specific)